MRETALLLVFPICLYMILRTIHGFKKMYRDGEIGIIGIIICYLIALIAAVAVVILLSYAANQT